MSLRLSSSSLPASPGRRCVCLTCSSSLESLRAGLKSRNPPSLFGPLCQMKRCLNPGIVMQSICEPNFGRILQCCFHQHLPHIVYSIYPLPSHPASISPCHSYSSFMTIQQIFNRGSQQPQNSSGAFLPPLSGRLSSLSICSCRPGGCAVQGSRFSSSTTLPDEVLNFVKTHPLMDETVPLLGHRPWVVKTMGRYVSRPADLL